MNVSTLCSFRYEAISGAGNNIVNCCAAIGSFEINYAMIDGSAMMFAMRRWLNSSSFSKKEIINQFRKACRIVVKIVGEETILTDDEFIAFATEISRNLGGMDNMIANLAVKTKEMLENRHQNFKKRHNRKTNS